MAQPVKPLSGKKKKVYFSAKVGKSSMSEDRNSQGAGYAVVEASKYKACLVGQLAQTIDKQNFFLLRGSQFFFIKGLHSVQKNYSHGER